MSNLAPPQQLDPAPYWEESARALELQAIPDSEVTGANRDQYAGAIAVIDDLGEQAREGATTGTPILDRLIISGQIIAPERLAELDAVEQMLLTDEPLMLQRGYDWKVGIVADDEIYFNSVGHNRKSMFGPVSTGYQAIPVKSYVGIRINPLMVRFGDGYDTMTVKSIEPDNGLPEAGSDIGLPIGGSLGWNLPKYDLTVPSKMREMTEAYVGSAHSKDERDISRYIDAYQIGQPAVEANLGISLEELVEFAPNDALLDYLTSH
ncbi:MAG: hypothetical protein AAB436_00260 [Patescibacteria group bacterium]